MNYVDSDMVRDYINNEIDYIKQDMSISGYNKGLLLDLNKLESLTDKDVQEIAQKVNDDEELQDKLNELMNYWIYHK